MFRRVAAAALAASMLMPLAVSAKGRHLTENTNESSDHGSSNAGANFCTQLAKRPSSEKFANILGGHRQKLLEKRTERDADLKKKREERDAREAEMRAKADAHRAELIAKLKEKFTSDAQKQAIIAFQQAVDAAVKAKRAAMDAAQDAFRKGLDQLLTGRQTAIDAALKAFSDAILAAEAKAKADCAKTGADPVAIRAAFRTSVEAARDQLKTALSNVEKVGPSLQALLDTRKAAFDKAKDDFHAALDKAKVALQAVLGTVHPEGNENENANENANENSNSSHHGRGNGNENENENQNND